MRKFLLVLAILSVAPCVWASEEKPVPPRVPRAIDWMQSYSKEREEGLLAALMAVKAAGVKMEGRFLEYEDALRRHLLRHPEYQQSPLTDALADYLYETDPSARPILDKLRTSGKTPG